MPVTARDLAAHLDAVLEVGAFTDHAPNGLQVEGDGRPLERVVTGVSANMALIEAAVSRGADAIVVHHGFFWRNEPLTLTGVRYRRVAALVRSGIALLGYHLPLDAHPTLGNNARLLQALGCDTADEGLRRFGSVGFVADLPAPLPREEVLARLESLLRRPPLAFLHGPAEVRSVACCTGGAPLELTAAVGAGADLFVTGEPSEQSQAMASELAASFVAGGHHATERFGPQALAEHLRAELGVHAEMVDVDNPV